MPYGIVHSPLHAAVYLSGACRSIIRPVPCEMRVVSRRCRDSRVLWCRGGGCSLSDSVSGSIKDASMTCHLYGRWPRRRIGPRAITVMRAEAGTLDAGRNGQRTSNLQDAAVHARGTPERYDNPRAASRRGAAAPAVSDRRGVRCALLFISSDRRVDRRYLASYSLSSIRHGQRRDVRCARGLVGAAARLARVRVICRRTSLGRSQPLSLGRCCLVCRLHWRLLRPRSRAPWLPRASPQAPSCL